MKTSVMMECEVVTGDLGPDIVNMNTKFSLSFKGSSFVCTLTECSTLFVN